MARLTKLVLVSPLEMFTTKIPCFAFFATKTFIQKLPTVSGATRRHRKTFKNLFYFRNIIWFMCFSFFPGIRMILFLVFRVVTKQFKIFYSIISFNPVFPVAM